MNLVLIGFFYCLAINQFIGHPLHYTASQRLEILNLALKDFSELEVDNSEIDRGGDSYMIDTLKNLKVKLNNESICLVIGMDSFVNFKTWKNWDEFSKIVHLIVLPREGEQPIEKALETFEVSSDIKQIKSQANGLLYFSNIRDDKYFIYHY